MSVSCFQGKQQSPLLNFPQKKSKFLQILQLAICQLIYNMYDWKYFFILVPASYLIEINVLVIIIWQNIFYEKKILNS
jgi:hypothetical protein